jgi:hypothetical protein
MRLLRRNKVTYIIECSCDNTTKYVSVIDTQLGRVTMCSVHRYAKRYSNYDKALNDCKFVRSLCSPMGYKCVVS